MVWQAAERPPNSQVTFCWMPLQSISTYLGLLNSTASRTLPLQDAGGKL